jgi:hypothetical protein
MVIVISISSYHSLFVEGRRRKLSLSLSLSLSACVCMFFFLPMSTAARPYSQDLGSTEEAFHKPEISNPPGGESL